MSLQAFSKKVFKGISKRISNPINKMLIKRWQKKPIDDSLIVFESEGDMSDNAYALYNYLRNNGYLKKYKAVWLVDDINKYRNCSFGNTEFFKKFPYKTEPKRAKYLGTCKYYIYDHCNMLRDAEKRDGQKIIYLSHGGILKKAKAKVYSIQIFTVFHSY